MADESGSVEAETPDIEAPESDAKAAASAAFDAQFEESFDKVDTDRDDGEVPETKAEEDDGDGPDQADLDDEEEAELEDSEETPLEDAADEGAKAEADEDDDEEDEDMALHRAYTRLHEQGIPAKVLKRTPKAELIAWAKSVEAAKQEASKTEETEATSGDAKGEADEPAQANALDWAVAHKELAESLGVEEESLKPLFGVHDALKAEIKELRSLVETATSSARAAEGRATIDRNVRRLAAKYPELKSDPKAKQKLIDEAQDILAGLRANAKPVDEERLFSKAALLAFGPAKRSDMAQLRRNGASTPPPRRGGLTAPNTDDEYWAKALDYVDQGRPELARRLTPPAPRQRQRR